MIRLGAPAKLHFRLALVLLAAAGIAALVAFITRHAGGREAGRRDAEAQAVDGRTAVAQAGATARASTPADAAAKAWFVDAAGSIELSGRVFFDVRPASAVTVVLGDELTSDGLLTRRRVVTDIEGRFTFSKVPRIQGTYRVSASGPDSTPAWAVVPGDVSKDDIELRSETCRTHVYGIVTDASGGEIAAAKVFLEMVPDHGVLSDAQGRFELCLPSRSAKLRVEADGYGPWQRYVSPRGLQRQDVTLMPEASIAGSVVFAEGGGPVPWALVSLRAVGAAIRDVQADGAGRFDIAKIAPGTYTIEARTHGARSKAPLDVAVFASSKASVVVPLDSRVRVRGRVVSREGPVARATINLGFNATFEWGTAVRTFDDGSFTIDDAPIGNLFVKVDDYEVETPRTLRVPDAGLTDATIQVALKGELRVTVTRKGTSVSDATVFLRGGLASDATTNAAGVATFRGFGDETYRVFVEHDNDFAVKEAVKVTRGAPTDVALELGAGRHVAGRVVDEQGKPVDGARVSFLLASSAEDAGASAITAADGSFRGGPLRGPATYRAKITRSGFQLDPQSDFPRLTVPESGLASPANLLLVVKTQDKALSGVVVDAAGGPVRDARVIVTRPERHSDTLATTFTGNDGTFTFRALGGGPYAVKALAVSGSEAEVKSLTLPTAPVRIELPSVGSIRGVLKGFTRTPSVMAWSVAGYEWDFHPAVVDSGRFTIAGLSRGRYHVAASTAETAAHATVDVVAENPVDVELIASGTRTIQGHTRDFVSGEPLPNLRCQAAPYVTDTRSPVVVPGVVFSDAQGAFELVSVPASDLYMWCTSDAMVRGGVARLPAELGERPVVVWGLDLRGKPPLDLRTLGMTLADDHPFSRRVIVVEPKAAAERAGVKMGDVIDTIGERSVAELGNGTTRAYLALLLMERKTVPIRVIRGETVVPLLFRVD